MLFRIAAQTQVLTDTDASILGWIGSISDTGIGIERTLDPETADRKLWPKLSFHSRHLTCYGKRSTGVTKNINIKGCSLLVCWQVLTE